MDNDSAATQWDYAIDDDETSDVRSIMSSSSEEIWVGDNLRGAGLDPPRAVPREGSFRRHYSDIVIDEYLPEHDINELKELLQGQQRSESLVKPEPDRSSVNELLQGQQRSESLVKPDPGRTSLPSPPSDADRPFPLLKLPKELRLNVFDQLFLDLTEGRQHWPEDLHRYRYPDRWPDNDLSAYLHLLLTRREIHDEARQLWETVYIRQCYFYFWEVSKLYRVACALGNLGWPYTRAKYVLRSRPFEENGDRETAFIDEESEDLMMYQPGFPHDDPEYADHHWGWPKFPFDGPKGEHHLKPGCIPFEIYRWGRSGRTCARSFFPALDHCLISVHERRVGEGRLGTRYSQMDGDIGSIFWGAYDAATGHAKLMIYEEWMRRGSPETCLDKASAVLAWKSRAQAGLDERWTELKGDLVATFGRMEATFSLDNWLRERPL